MTNIITIKYGGDQHRTAVEPTATIGSIISNPSLKAVLGYGDNVKALVHGVDQSMSTSIGNATELVLETKANEKAN